MRRSLKFGPKRRPWADCRLVNTEIFGNFRAESGGNVLVLFSLSAPILILAVGLAADVGSWEAAHRRLQSAADSAAISAVVGFQAGVDVPTQAKAVAASYHFVSGVAGTTVTANRPPQWGAYAGNSAAVEVIISQPQARMFSALLGGQSVAERARAVALQTSNACILALDQTASNAISAQGSVAVNANGCSIYSDSNSSTSVNAGGSARISAQQIGAVGDFSGQSNMTTVDGFTHGAVIADPYAYVTPPMFSGCDEHNFSSKKTETISPGVYCGGLTLNAGANVTMSPGIYYIDQGSFTVNGSATLTGTGVTIVFTSSTPSSPKSYATANIAGGASINLTAPTSGPTAGIVLYGDRNMPVGTSFNLAGGSSQILTGVTYFPKGAVSFAGGASSFNGCSQVVGDTVNFVGNSGLATNCSSLGIKKIGAIAQLVE
ncbi:pilus assembly protein TadG-related protein [Rhodoblastus acidophilus]|uniref:Pilus assembly protein TadG-related protein n=1 Tax=Candidatus Rhodoblastus alkanivorans TaxID=2954117 RepID=A0ABS9Z5P8_9HYPH|nr:pilus assembly protein TadG-related protein [Candidatus Rhodoblastus alkanivorans]MCI4680115.1 pilus assembly protein TadG-related protein [Candidatus Rhodoblastus alkanivorans]MCI4682993.1 pilus assembly protein TadG-related protein [Candidatus Rhodoblastus alkanivorans]MDI4640303.1 pilus assembly protein TadG-related protein [Rhodoblastus acidophilus]